MQNIFKTPPNYIKNATHTNAQQLFSRNEVMGKQHKKNKTNVLTGLNALKWLKYDAKSHFWNSALLF